VGFLKPVMETGDLTVQLRCRTDVEKTDHRHRCLLCTRRQRPPRRTADPTPHRCALRYFPRRRLLLALPQRPVATRRCP